MKQIFFSACFSFVLSQSFGQQQMVVANINTNDITISNAGTDIGVNKYHVLSGSPYFNNFNKFLLGKVFLNNKWNDVEIRFNTFTGKLEYLASGRVFELSQNQIHKFSIENATFQNGYKKFEKLDESTYFQLMSESATKQHLLKYSYTELQEVRNADDTKQGDKYVSYNKYLIADSNNSIVYSFVLRKQFLKYIEGEKAKKVEKFIEKEGIKFKNDEELVKVFDFYLSL